LQKGVHALFGVQFSLEYISQWTEYFQPLRQMLERIKSNEPFLISGEPSVSDAMEKIINELCLCSHIGAMRKMYMDIRAQELLRLTLEPSPEFSDLTSASLPDYEILKFEEIKSYVTDNLDSLGSLKEIALWAGLNEHKLKTGFKQLYGMPIFAFALDLRMQRAKRLLLESDLAIKAIAEMTGYSDKSNFTYAFKRKFGISPRDLRQGNF
jgi:AraC-like DNA-binding protein